MSRGQDVESIVNLDALRGWRETRDPVLRGDHSLKPLAELVQLGEDDAPGRSTFIHGTDILVGRFQSQYAPVDLLLPHLEDHQLYRLGAPHAHLFLNPEGWQLQPLSPRSLTRLNDRLLENLSESVALNDGDVITLGVSRFRFRPLQGPARTWIDARKELLNQAGEPAIFLKRAGSPCGPYVALPQQSPLVLGRSYPEPGVLPGTESWPERGEHFWDLSGLFDFERRHVAFRHAAIGLQNGRWIVEPLSSRQRTFVNRIAISGRIALEPGDEIGLGTVLFRFHHPHRSPENSRPRRVPTVLDWGEGLPSRSTGEKR